MKYRAIYMAGSYESELFDKEEQAWKWIVNHCKKCSIQGDERKRCYHCEAEWDVEETEELLELDRNEE